MEQEAIMDEKRNFLYEYPIGMHVLYADNTRPQHPDYYPDVVYVEVLAAYHRSTPRKIGRE